MSADETSFGGLPAADPEFARNPQPMYRMLRDAGPAFQADGVGVIVSSRAATDQVLRQADIFSSNVEATDLKTKRPMIPLQIDPPAHRNFRRLLDPLFAPARMKALEQPARVLVNALIDTFVDDDEIDFARQFSMPFPSQVFLTLMGLPLADLPQFLKMKDGIIRPQHVVGQPLGHPDTDAYQQATADSIYAYFEQVLDERADDRGDDLISLFLDAEVDGDRLSRNDILDICFNFIIAGLDTVTAALDCFFGYLARNPDQQKIIVDDPDVIPRFVEELLRWETPVMAVARVATQDTEVGGCPIARGQQVIALIGAANLDDDEFPNADLVQWDRDPNRHLTFGGGIHRCLGSHLARLELRVALREWHRRIPAYSVKPGVALDYTPGIRALDSFPMVLGNAVIGFDGQAVVVTGAGRGLGRLYALDLARRGASVVVNDLGGSMGGDGADTRVADDVVEEIRAAGGVAVASYDSVETPTGGAAIVERALDEFGGLDAVISNAGIFHPAPFDELTSDDWQRMLRVHLDGAFNLSQPAYRRMKSRGYGRFVFIASSAGLFGQPNSAHYAAAKAGTVGLANVIAIEGAEHGIVANCVLPFGYSRMVFETTGHRDEIEPDPGFLHAIEPELVVPIVVYLASRGCEITHQNFSACAGRFARVFIGLGDGWVAEPKSCPTAEDIGERLAQITASDPYTIPDSIFDEVFKVCAQIGIG